jgi:hypothetical protein
MATLRVDRLIHAFIPKPPPRESKKIYSYASSVFKKTGGATPALVEVYKTYLGTKKAG